MSRLLLLLLFSFSIFYGHSQAQDQPLRVGVVLSGGGAKGYAHVGALKVIEEAGIRVDYIAGTSMGAIVGGLYAAGWSPEQLDSLLGSTNIGGVIQESVERRYRSFFEKQYAEKYALSLSFRDFRIQLPTAFSNGQDVFNLFTRWTMGVNHLNDFSRLPVPFLCIATDVATGEQVMLDQGFLPLAMRSSGALPGLLTPVEVDGRLLTDGGLVNNFPARELRERGMDVIIGISVEDGLFDQEQLTSIPRILYQIATYQTVRSSVEQQRYIDVLIHPNTQGFTVTSFTATDTLVARGAAAATVYLDTLRAIARRQQAAAAPPTRREPLPLTDSLYIDTVRVFYTPAATQANVLRAFPGLPGQLAVSDFFEGLKELYAGGRYDFIRYGFTPSGVTGDDGLAGRNLLIEPKVRSGYDRLLRVGLHYDPVYNSSLLLNLSFVNLGFPNSNALFDLILGDKLRYNFHYLIEPDRGPDLGLNSSLQYNEFDFEFPEALLIDTTLRLESVRAEFLDFSNEFYTRLFHTRNAALGLAMEIKYFRASTDQLVVTSADVPLITRQGGTYTTGTLFYRYDSRDDRNFAMHGSDLDLRARTILPLAPTERDRRRSAFTYNLDLNAEKLIPLGPSFSLGLAASAGATLNDPVQPYYYLLGSINQNLINNFRPFIGLPIAGAAGTDLLMARIYGRWRVLRNQYVTVSGQWAYLEDAGTPFSPEPDRLYSLGLSYGIATPLGPVEVTYGLADGDRSWYVNVGHWF